MSIKFLSGEKISLRPFQALDADLLCHWFNDPDVTYYMFTGQRPRALEQVKSMMEYLVNSFENEVFIIVDNQSQEAVGLIGLHEIDYVTRKSELRLMIGNKDFWGKGYGTEAVQMVTFYGFDRLNLNKIYLGYTAGNEAARKTYEKAGFQVEGVLKMDIYRNSTYYDGINMAMFRDNYYPSIFNEHKKKFANKYEK